VSQPIIVPPELAKQLTNYLLAAFNDRDASDTAIGGVIGSAFARVSAATLDGAAAELSRDPKNMAMGLAATLLREWAEEARSTYR
jgi:hypothetical protein